MGGNQFIVVEGLATGGFLAMEFARIEGGLAALFEAGFLLDRRSDGLGILFLAGRAGEQQEQYKKSGTAEHVSPSSSSSFWGKQRTGNEFSYLRTKQPPKGSPPMAIGRHICDEPLKTRLGRR